MNLMTFARLNYRAILWVMSIVILFIGSFFGTLIILGFLKWLGVDSILWSFVGIVLILLITVFLSWPLQFMFRLGIEKLFGEKVPDGSIAVIRNISGKIESFVRIQDGSINRDLIDGFRYFLSLFEEEDFAKTLFAKSKELFLSFSFLKEEAVYLKLFPILVAKFPDDITKSEDASEFKADFEFEGKPYNALLRLILQIDTDNITEENLIMFLDKSFLSVRTLFTGKADKNIKEQVVHDLCSQEQLATDTSHFLLNEGKKLVKRKDDWFQDPDLLEELTRKMEPKIRVNLQSSLIKIHVVQIEISESDFKVRAKRKTSELEEYIKIFLTPNVYSKVEKNEELTLEENKQYQQAITDATEMMRAQNASNLHITGGKLK